MTATSSGRVVLVTGAAGGIGSALVDAAVARGDVVYALDIASPTGDAAHSAHWVNCDVTDAVAVSNAVNRVIGESGRLDVVFNNAGVRAPATPFLEISPASWRATIDINLTGIFLVAQAAARAMAAAGSGVIVNTVSQLAEAVLPGHAAYSVSKAAVKHLTSGMALELGPLGVRVVGVAPGIVDTAMTQKLQSDPAWVADRLARVPLGRFASPEEIAEFMHVIASEVSAYAHGSTYVFDGGYLVSR